MKSSHFPDLDSCMPVSSKYGLYDCDGDKFDSGYMYLVCIPCNLALTYSYLYRIAHCFEDHAYIDKIAEDSDH